jgi:formate dehydrogenase beta subunit
MTIYTRGGFAYPNTSLAFKTGTWRVQKPQHIHTSAPCHGACPAGEDPQAYLALVDAGRVKEAWENLVKANPLPAITGRVCHHPCEAACNRGQYDEAVGIHNVERFLGDQAIEQGWQYPVSRPAVDAPRIAVVGAGPAGLSAAYHLLRNGLNVTLYTALSEPGGTLHAIPGYRLPADVIKAETERLLQTGFDFQPNQRLGRDIYLNDLRDNFAAVFIAVGTQQGKEWSVGGVVPHDLHNGLELLNEWMSIGTVPCAKSAVVVGGGNTAIDLARVLKRADVPEVHLITHNGLPGPDTPPEDAMSANPREIEQALEEGITLHTHRGIRRLILRGEHVVGVEMVHMKKLRNAQGILERVAFEGTETVLHVDQVIPAIGQVVDPAGLEILLAGKRHINVDHWGRTPDQAGLYAGGDASRGGKGSVTAAVGDGRRAAEAIARQLRGESSAAPVDIKALSYERLNLHYFEHAPRIKHTTLPVAQRLKEEEVEGGLDTVQATAESRRCFSCGNCLACDNCWTLCPDNAVLKTKEIAADGSHYVFDYDYCKGCGLCAHECPCGFIQMEEDL